MMPLFLIATDTLHKRNILNVLVRTVDAANPNVPSNGMMGRPPIQWWELQLILSTSIEAAKQLRCAVSLSLRIGVIIHVT